MYINIVVVVSIHYELKMYSIILYLIYYSKKVPTFMHRKLVYEFMEVIVK